MNGDYEIANVEDIKYDDLLNETVDLSQKIENGFGCEGIGLITISGVPNYCELRERLLPLGEKLAELSENDKKMIEDPLSKYSFGWSHGKETLESGKLDVMKGSFYANPVHDIPTTNIEDIKNFPSYCRSNIWPEEKIPELKKSFKDLGELIINVGFLLIKHCDKYIMKKNPEFEYEKLFHVLKKSKNHKARLLHYFPLNSINNDDGDNDDAFSSWCGWHSDHGALTGLTSAMYFENGKKIPNPDSSSGLFVLNRKGKLYKVNIPPSSIAYQIGESFQIFSSRFLNSTPHCVKASLDKKFKFVSRNTFAVFMQPSWNEILEIPKGCSSPSDIGVSQWEPGLSFGTFSENTFRKYYDSLIDS